MHLFELLSDWWNPKSFIERSDKQIEANKARLKAEKEKQKKLKEVLQSKQDLEKARRENIKLEKQIKEGSGVFKRKEGDGAGFAG